MKHYLKVDSITEKISQHKLNEKPDISSFEEQLKNLLKEMNLSKTEISNLMIYKTTKKEENEHNLPDYLWLKKGRIPKNEIKFKSAGIEHTKINPYKNKR